MSAAPMIIVTHDLEEAAGIAGQAAFMDAGTVLETGPASALPGEPGSRLNRWLAGRPMA